MTNLLVIVVAALTVQTLSCLEVKPSVVRPRNRTTVSRPRSPSRPLPCFDFFAYCQKPYNVSRPNMTRMEGELALSKPPQDISRNKFLDHRCFCDADCRQYGDCCLDVLTDVDRKLTLEEFEAGMMTNHSGALRDWECHTLPMTDTEVYMVGSCPPSQDSAAIASRCRRQVPPQDYDYTLDLPVLSQVTNVTYVNVYCAICNDDKRLRHWSIQIHCPDDRPNCTSDVQFWEYVPGQRFWRYGSSVGSSNVTYSVVNVSLEGDDYYQNFGARKCRKEVIGCCPASWKGVLERALCRSYSLVVKTRTSSRLYRNEYCAICNGEPIAELLCPKVVRHRPEVTAPKPLGGLHSYALLLDFMGQGDQVGEAGACGPSGLLCGFGELCDPLHARCRVYTCGRKYRMDEGGKCVAIDFRSANLTDLDSDCPKFYVSRDRFVRHRNGSVYIRALDRLYNISQYEVVNATAILVCTAHELHFSWKFSTAQSVLSRACVTLSLVCLAVHIAIHLVTPPLLNLPGKNLLCLSAALFVAQLAFEFGLAVTTARLCVGIGLTVHFSFLAAFFWMNVMAVDVFRTFGTAVKTRSPGQAVVGWDFWVYSAYAWLVPVIVVLTALTNDFTHWMPGFEPSYGSPLCWFNNRQGLLLFFALPLAILLVVNTVLFSLSVIAICRTRKSTKVARRNSSSDSKDRTRMLLYVKLALIMGLTWILGFVAALVNLDVLWYFFILFNCLQGAFIFIAFSCKKNVLQLMRGRWCGGAPHALQASKSTKTTSDSQRLSFHTLMTTMSRKLSSFDGQQQSNNRNT